MFLHHHMKSSHWATPRSNSRGSQVGDPQQLGLALRIGHRRAVSARQVRGPRLVCALDALDAKVEMAWLMLDICVFFMGETYGKTNCFFWSILVATEIMVEGYGFESNEGGDAKIMALGD